MTDRIDFRDFRDDEGNFDFRRHKAAQVDNGERCEKCDQPFLRPTGARRLCTDCESLRTNPEGYVHERLVRCPSCLETFDPEVVDTDLLTDGDHHATCPHCDAEFQLRTVVRYLFESPAIEAATA